MYKKCPSFTWTFKKIIVVFILPKTDNGNLPE